MSWVARPGVGLSAHIGNLSSTLICLTTDYAAPIMERFGFPAAALGILQERLRPEVEVLGEDVIGLVAADMDATMLEILTAMDRAGLDVAGVTRFLCSLCHGSDSRAAIWVGGESVRSTLLRQLSSPFEKADCI